MFDIVLFAVYIGFSTVLLDNNNSLLLGTACKDELLFLSLLEPVAGFWLEFLSFTDSDLVLLCILMLLELFFCKNGT